MKTNREFSSQRDFRFLSCLFWFFVKREKEESTLMLIIFDTFLLFLMKRFCRIEKFFFGILD